MSKITKPLLAASLILSSAAATLSQEGPSSENRTYSEKTVIVASKATSDPIVAVPPSNSVELNLRAGKSSGATDLATWLNKQRALNGLQTTDLLPWHIVVTYDQFDEDGDNVHSGVYEEYWAGPKKYRKSYKADDLDQTDYATDKGLYRVGNQMWPNRAQSQVQSEIIDPFYYAATLDGFHGRDVERTFGRYKLQCLFVEKSPQQSSDPTQYCFEPDNLVLRYARGFGWFQTVYNRIVQFQGRNLAQEVDVTDGGKPYLKLRVTTIELLSTVDDSMFLPPPNAVGPIAAQISGVNLTPVYFPGFPNWPPSLKNQHFTVTVDIIIGTDGHVASAHAIAGPPEGFKAAEDTAKLMLFTSYSVFDQRVQVEQKVEFGHN